MASSLFKTSKTRASSHFGKRRKEEKEGEVQNEKGREAGAQRVTVELDKTHLFDYDLTTCLFEAAYHHTGRIGATQ